MINKINYLFVTLFGLGKLTKIPGSIASLATIIILFFGPKVATFINACPLFMRE